MARQHRRPYDPIRILLMPRYSSAVHAIQSISNIIDDVDYAIATADDDRQAILLRNQWLIDDEVPLLILRVGAEATSKASVDAIAHISSANSDSAVCVFLVDGYDVDGYLAEKRNHWNRQFATALQKAVLDSQIHEYSNTWATSPPRAR